MTGLFSTYGFDPGLTRGAIVHATFDFSGSKHNCKSWFATHYWDKKQAEVGAKSQMLEVSQFAHKVLLPKFPKPAYAVGIEFSPSAVYWRVQKSQIVALAYLLGYLERGLQAQGLPVTQIKVEQLKKAFNISPKEKKEEYTARPVKLMEFSALKFSVDPSGHPSDYPDDVFDAFLLAYLTAYLISTRS